MECDEVVQVRVKRKKVDSCSLHLLYTDGKSAHHAHNEAKKNISGCTIMCTLILSGHKTQGNISMIFA